MVSEFSNPLAATTEDDVAFSRRLLYNEEDSPNILSLDG